MSAEQENISGGIAPTRRSTPDPHFLSTLPEHTCDELYQVTLNGMLDGLRQSYVLITAIDRRIFDHTEVPISSSELSANIKTDGKLTELFCECLVGMGMMAKTGDGKYVNTGLSDLYFTTESPMSQTRNLTALFRNIGRWQRLSMILERGPDKIDINASMVKEDIRLMGEMTLGGEIGSVLKYIEGHIDISKKRTLLDLAGGHGMYAIGFCQAYPNLEGAVFDRPQIIECARDNIAAYGSSVRTIQGDFYKDELGGGYDIIFSSFNRSCSDCTLIPKIQASLNNGGFLVIRRHSKKVTENPLHNLEWNMSSISGKTNGSKKHEIALTDTSEEYIEAMRSSGIRLVCRDEFDNRSEIMIFQNGSGE
jgi:predicted nicotinamide N-methyase